LFFPLDAVGADAGSGECRVIPVGDLSTAVPGDFLRIHELRSIPLKTTPFEADSLGACVRSAEVRKEQFGSTLTVLTERDRFWRRFEVKRFDLRFRGDAGLRMTGSYELRPRGWFGGPKPLASACWVRREGVPSTEGPSLAIFHRDSIWRSFPGRTAEGCAEEAVKASADLGRSVTPPFRDLEETAPPVVVDRITFGFEDTDGYRVKGVLFRLPGG
jgi:hypothetical protein